MNGESYALSYLFGFKNYCFLVHIMLSGAILNFIDIFSFLYIIIPAIVVMLFTKTSKNLFKAISFTFYNNMFYEKEIYAIKDVSIKDVKLYKSSVKLLIYTLNISGVLSFLIGFINTSVSIDLSVGANYLLISSSISLIAFFYSMYFTILLLPVIFSLNKYIISNS